MDMSTTGSLGMPPSQLQQSQLLAGALNSASTAVPSLTSSAASTTAAAQQALLIGGEDAEQQEIEKQRQRMQMEMQHKEDSCRLLVVICRYFPNLVISYDKAIIQVLLDILKEPNSVLSSFALKGKFVTSALANENFSLDVHRT